MQHLKQFRKKARKTLAVTALALAALGLGLPAAAQPQTRAASCRAHDVSVYAEGMMMPYAMEFAANEQLMVTTMEGVKRVRLSGEVSSFLNTAVGSPSGILRDGNTWYVIENATGRLLKYEDGASAASVMHENLGDPVTLAKHQGKLLVTDYDLGGGQGRVLHLRMDGSREQVQSGGFFSGPSGIVGQPGRYVYTEFDLGELREVNAAGQMRVLATRLGLPVDVRPYRNGYLVADFGGFDAPKGRLLYVTPSRRVHVIADTAQLTSAVGLTLRGDTAYVSDMLGGRVLKVRLPSDARCYN